MTKIELEKENRQLIIEKKELIAKLKHSNKRRKFPKVENTVEYKELLEKFNNKTVRISELEERVSDLQDSLEAKDIHKKTLDNEIKNFIKLSWFSRLLMTREDLRNLF